MNAMNDGFRVLMVLRVVAAESSGLVYSEVRSSLERLSWVVVDRFRRAGFYALVTSFPRWTNPVDMGDFGLIHPHFPVNSDGCLCIQIQPSPIRECFEDAHALGPISPESREMISKLDASKGFEIPSDPRWGPCLQELRESAIGQSLKLVGSAPEVCAGFLSASTGAPLEAVVDDSIESGIVGLWLNIGGALPREMGFRFGALAP